MSKSSKSVLALCVAMVPAVCAGQLRDKADYFQTCDASAGVPVNERLFAVASDEDNWLRVYDRRGPDQPVQSFNLASLLGIAAGDEADLEGATQIGSASYWIGSHGADGSGNPSPSRQFLFALKLDVSDTTAACAVVGKPYSKLLPDLLDSPAGAKYRLREASKLPPKEAGALNIEGLAALGDELLIGFRNPIPGGKAILLPLTNPHDVLAEQGGEAKPAKFGEAIELDLGSRGIRSIEYSPHQQEFWIVAGSFNEERDFALYRWKGPGQKPREVELDFGKWRPEGVIVWPNRRGEIQILSDDGERVLEEIDENSPCKKLPFEKRQFRGGWVSVAE